MIPMSIKTKEKIKVLMANTQHFHYAKQVCDMIEKAAKIRGTGIAKRSSSYIKEKIEEGKAIIALDDETVIGFCYIESWQNSEYVANSGLIVDPDYRGYGLAKKIKKQAFELSRKKFPQAKMFGLTTSLPVMRINSSLGYVPVTFSELTSDSQFWQGCNSCVNFDILNRTDRKMCLCTGMLYNPNKK